MVGFSSFVVIFNMKMSMKMKAKPIVEYCFFMIQVKAPVIVVKCKLDLQNENHLFSMSHHAH